MFILGGKQKQLQLYAGNHFLFFFRTRAAFPPSRLLHFFLHGIFLEMMHPFLRMM